jgi:hypothetical protein
LSLSSCGPWRWTGYKAGKTGAQPSSERLHSFVKRKFSLILETKTILPVEMRAYKCEHCGYENRITQPDGASALIGFEPRTGGDAFWLTASAAIPPSRSGFLYSPRKSILALRHSPKGPRDGKNAIADFGQRDNRPFLESCSDSDWNRIAAIRPLRSIGCG